MKKDCTAVRTGMIGMGKLLRTDNGGRSAKLTGCQEAWDSTNLMNCIDFEWIIYRYYFDRVYTIGNPHNQLFFLLACRVFFSPHDRTCLRFVDSRSRYESNRIPSRLNGFFERTRHLHSNQLLWNGSAPTVAQLETNTHTMEPNKKRTQPRPVVFDLDAPWLARHDAGTHVWHTRGSHVVPKAQRALTHTHTPLMSSCGGFVVQFGKCDSGTYTWCMIMTWTLKCTETDPIIPHSNTGGMAIVGRPLPFLPLKNNENRNSIATKQALGRGHDSNRKPQPK